MQNKSAEYSNILGVGTLHGVAIMLAEASCKVAKHNCKIKLYRDEGI